MDTLNIYSLHILINSHSETKGIWNSRHVCTLYFLRSSESIATQVHVLQNIQRTAVSKWDFLQKIQPQNLGLDLVKGRINFQKIHFQTIHFHFQKIHFRKMHFRKIHFQKLHFQKIHFLKIYSSWASSRLSWSSESSGSHQWSLQKVSSLTRVTSVKSMRTSTQSVTQ